MENTRVDLFELLFGRVIALQQIPFETIQRIVVLLPPLDLAFANVTLIVVFRVALATIRLRFDQNRAAAATRVIRGRFRYFVTRDHVVAVDDVSGNTVARGFLGKIAHGGLQTGRRRIRVMIVLSNHDQRQLLHGREVETFVKRAGAHAAVADVSDADKLLLCRARQAL